MANENSMAPVPVLAADHQWMKPDEFTLVKVGTPSGDAYIVSFIEHVLLPKTVQSPDGEKHGLEVIRRVRSTMQMPVSLFKQLNEVAADVELRSAAKLAGAPDAD